MASSQRIIELLIDTSTSWGRGLTRGAVEYAREQENWKVRIEPTGRSEQLRLHPSWTGDGVIARVNSPELAEDLIRMRVPAVNVSWYEHGFPTIPQCTVNEVLSGEIAADHFMECGLRNFAYFGTNRPGYRDRLGEAYIASVERQGHICHVANAARGPFQPQVRLNTTDRSLLQWLKLLPLPVGLFTWSDVQGRRLTAACEELGLRVPEDVAVLSGEHDELMSELSRPILSSIDPAPERVGYEAAALLDRLMQGDPAPRKPRLVPPHGVLRRQSTEIFAVPDPHVAKALRYIREHLGETIHINDLINQTGISRRALELRFSQLLGRTPAREVRRCRIERAKQLVLNSTQALGQIAKACGYPHQETFTRAFSQEVGMTPSEFRMMAKPRHH